MAWAGALAEAGGGGGASGDYCIPMPTSDGITSLAWSPDPASSMLAAGSCDGRVHVWNVRQTPARRVVGADSFPLGRRVTADEVGQEAAFDAVMRPDQLSAAAGELFQSGRCAGADGVTDAILGVAWSGDGSTVFGGTKGGSAYMWPVDAGPGADATEFGRHLGPVKGMAIVTEPGAPLHNLVITIGWDKNVRYWDVRQPQHVANKVLRGRPLGLDVVYPHLAIAEEGRHTVVYDLRRPGVVKHRTPSPLRYETRSIALFPDSNGVVLGSSEGRVAIQHLDSVEPRFRGDDFVFKCHRRREIVADATSATGIRQQEKVFAVTALAFHPYCFHKRWEAARAAAAESSVGGAGASASHRKPAVGGQLAPVFASGGADGGVVFWNKDEKVKLKALDPDPARGQVACAALDWNSSGTMLATALCPDWGARERGQDKPTGISAVMIHDTPDSDLKRGAK